MCSLPVNLGRWPFSVTYCWNVWAAVTDDGNADSSSLQATCISRLLLPLQKKLYFLWQGNSPWHFFFQLAVLRSPHEAAHTTPVGAVSVSLNRYVDSELENKLCPCATVRNSQNMTRPSDGLLWFKPPAKLLSALHIYIYLPMAYTCKYMYKQTYIWIQKSNYLFQ